MRRRPYEGPEARPHMRNDLSFQTMMSTQVRPANAHALLGRSASAGLTLQFTMSLRRRLAFRIGMAVTEPLCFSAIAAKCWWSQTGSNRRPHACKARALPTELWPLRNRSAGAVVACPPQVSHKVWWAQADSNCRRHAYQACALTN